MQTVIFRKAREAYKRDTNVRKGYVDQASLCLSRLKNISLEEARSFITTGLSKGGAFEFKDPVVTFLHRENFEDRELKETTMSQFLKDVVDNNESLAPTFTSYCSPDTKQSLIALFTKDNIGQRDIIKGEMFEAQNAGDMVTYTFKNIGQTNAKQTNNAASGASLTPSTAAFNPTTHSTLTTNCRNTTAYGNANNEKFIEGNRHYADVDTIINNLVSITQMSNYEEVEIAMRVFQLKYPTTTDVLDCIERSKQLYFRSNSLMGIVYDFVEKMKPLERAAFVYTGDFYHTYEHNRTFVTNFLNDMIIVPKEPLTLEESKFVMKVSTDDTINLARQLCRSFSAGKKPRDILAESEHNYGILAATVKHLEETLVNIQPFINAFWLSDNMPASTGMFPFSVRRSVLGGDTDSTLFTVQEWVGRIYGTIGFEDDMDSTADVMIYLAAMTSSHLHAKMSANYGAHPSRIFDTVMKNEYKFDLFFITSMAKHYGAIKTAQEGNVFTKPKLELKGANMISSATPGDIVQNVKDYIMNLMKDVTAGKDVFLNDLVDLVAEKEREIYLDVKTGSTDYFRVAKINSSKSYKSTDPDRTPYWNHIFWNRTFGKVYGMVDEPPYTMVKVSLEINNVSEFNAWMDKIQNKRLKEDIAEELARIGRKFLTIAHVPSTIIQVSGIPEEILEGSNARKIVRGCCGAYYHILESMGLPMANKKNTRMIYDTY